MKRRSRKETTDTQRGDVENDDDEKSSSLEDSDKEAESEPKKRKSSNKRKSASIAEKKPLVQDTEDIEDDEDNKPQYEVEDILDEKYIKGVRHYLIRWKGYEPESDSWEPESTLSCPELVKKFHNSRNENRVENEISKKSRKSAASDSSKRTSKNYANLKKSPSNKKSKSGSKSSKDRNKSADWNSDDEFEVDRIVEVYFKRNGKREFLVSWKGYPPSENSWEPEENLDCKDLISKFMNKVEAAKQIEQKELRVYRVATERFTLSMHASDKGRRLSRRLRGKQRVQYHDAE